jgi:hypothetical protein
LASYGLLLVQSNQKKVARQNFAAAKKLAAKYPGIPLAQQIIGWVKEGLSE